MVASRSSMCILCITVACSSTAFRLLILCASKFDRLILLQVDRKRRHVNLTLRTWKGQQEGKSRQPAVGDLVAGRVVAVSGTGVRVQLGARLHGRVPLTDLHDSWRDNALEGASAALPCLTQMAEPPINCSACCCIDVSCALICIALALYLACTLIC